MPLNKNQKAAVEYLEGPLLVLAGPGTGKTQLLSSKVEYILKNTDANPENILCLTYTESGAQNMRDRLFSMIGAAASKVRIHTYHAFGSTILAEYKNYADNFDRNLDNAIDTITEYKIIKNIQDSLPAFDILKRANISDIISTIASAKSARLSGHDLEIIANDNIKTTEKLNPKLNDILKNLKKGMKFEAGVAEIYSPLMEVLAKFTDPKPIVGSIEKEANFLLRELANLIETERAKEKPSISPLTKWKDRRFEKDDAGNYRLANRISNKKLLSLAHIMQEYESQLESTGLYDFADMIEQAIKIVSTDKGFRLTLAERYQYILLDEFQDTNAAQAELIYKITDYEKPCIMAVGDDDQAIFAFQGANVSNLIDFEQHYHAKIITLLENYRSNSEILDMSYRVREQIEDSFAKSQGIDKKLSAFKSSGAKISRHEFIESSAEYHWVAEKINNLIKSGVKQSDIAIITPKHKYIAPLLPHLKSYDGINIAYEKRDNLFEDSRIHEILTISEFIYGLTKGQNPSHLLFEILSFPFLEVPPLEVVSAINRDSHKKAIDYLVESDSPKLHYVGVLLATLASKAATCTLEQFIDYLIGSSPLTEDLRSNFLEFYTKTDSYSTFELYENLTVLREAILAHAANKTNLKKAIKSIHNKSTKAANTKTNSLEDLIDFVEDYELAGAPLINTSPYQDASEAVQILTAHKAKGLEFDYVFIIATDDRAWGNAKGNNNMLSLPQNLVGIRHTGATEDECLRLFFVAITRAKSYLYLTNSLTDFSGKKPARLEYLAEYVEEAENPDTITIISPYLPDNAKKIQLHYQDLYHDKNLSDLKTHWVSNYLSLDGDLLPTLLKRVENYRLTATDLTTFIDIVYAGPQTFYEQKILRAPEESYSSSLTFGNLIHATFEKTANEKLTSNQALEFFQSELSSAPIPDEDREDMLERGRGTILATLDAFGDIIRSEHSRAEVNLSHDHLMLGTVPLTGKIDLLLIDPDTKTIEVYDYKTSAYHKENWNSHPTLFKYKLQLCFYKLLLNLSPEYSKYNVKKAHILSVVPDPVDGKVYDKVYEYNDAGDQVLKDLIRAEYSSIRTLSFIEDPDIFIPPDVDKNLREIKDFIALLLDKYK